MIRTFIAVNFPPAVIDKIAGITAYLQTQTPGTALKWVAPENMHLTLKFLGDVREDRVPEVKECLQEALLHHPTFNISVESLGMYPTASQPRVVWLGINDAGNLKQIHHNLAKVLKDFDPAPEKRSFSPHLTIARIRQNISRDIARQVGETLSQFKVDSLGSFEVQTVHLFKSELTPRGPIYSALFSIPLNQV
ncbi:MAG: RNA 2',3'-cyclic phosphodiesterase [Acidobacteriota bacterium]